MIRLPRRSVTRFFIPLVDVGIDPSSPDGGSLGNYSGSSFYCLDPNGTIGGRALAGPDQVLGTADDTTSARYTLHNRGDEGRTPWTHTFDVGVTYQPQWLEGLTLQMKVFNVLNSQTVTEYNEASQSQRTNLVTDADYLNDFNYQAPRFVRFTARYDF